MQRIILRIIAIALALLLLGTSFALIYPSHYIFPASNGSRVNLKLAANQHSTNAVSRENTQNYTERVLLIASGLPSISSTQLEPGTAWCLNLSNGVNSGPLTSPSYVLYLANGTYSYTVSTTNKTWAPSPSSGSFTVNGPLTQYIYFYPVKYQLTFIESGLPSGATWYVNLTNPCWDGTVVFSHAICAGQFFGYCVTNGTYSFTVSASNKSLYPSPASGSFIVDGSSVTESIDFIHDKYQVSFTESGLPSGTSWGVYVNGTLSTSSTSIIIFPVLNGTYSYEIVEPGGYIAQPQSGTFTIAGGSETEKIVFSPFTYIVEFSETGLSAYTSWSVTFDGVTNTSDTSDICFSAPNGTYTYSVHAISNFTVSPDYGTLTVNGKDMIINITFTQSGYSVTFSESGLPIGNEWSIEFNGSVSVSTDSTIVFYASNGTYGFSVGVVPGWTPSLDSGNLTVDGLDIVIDIFFNVTTYNVTFVESGLPFGNATNLTWSISINAMIAGKYLSILEKSRIDSISFSLRNGTYSYSAESRYYTSIPDRSTVTVSGTDLNVPVKFEPSPVVSLNISPTGSAVTIGYEHFTANNTSYMGCIQPGYYFLNVTHSGYKPYSNYFYAAVTMTYQFNISLVKLASSGELRGTVSPYNIVILANGTPIPTDNGSYNITLSPGTYYLTAFAFGYSPFSSYVAIDNGKSAWFNISLQKSQYSFNITGFVNPVTSSVTVNGFSAYVNSSGYYMVSLPRGNDIISFYSPGYFPITENISVNSDLEMNVSLKSTPASTSSVTYLGVKATGICLTVENVSLSPGVVNITYFSSGNGTLFVYLPFEAIDNLTVTQLLASRVYLNGSQYHNFSVTITNNLSVILTVTGLVRGDPLLTWIFNPSKTINFVQPNPIQGVTWYYYLIIVAVILGASVSLLVFVRSKRK